MTRFANLGAVRLPLLAAAVLALLSVPALSQVVEKGRTFSDLTATHPCSSAYTDRIARVTDCDAADDIGDGEGAYQCWATCDGTAPWEAVAIGGGGAGVSGLSTADGGTALADNAVVRGDGAAGIQGSAVTIADTTGAISGAQSITGGTSGTSTLALDGDSGVAGAVTVRSDGGITLGANGTYTTPALKLAGGAGGIYDDWGTGGLALAYAGATSLAFVGGGTYVAIMQGSKFQFRSTEHLGLGTIGGSIDTGLAQYSAGVWKATNNDSGSQITALIGGGAAVASATALPIPTGRVFHVTGTTTITSITSTDFQNGVCITIIFDGVLTFTDGSNLKLNGDFVTTADDVISLCYDGASWFETGRSVN